MELNMFKSWRGNFHLLSPLKLVFVLLFSSFTSHAFALQMATGKVTSIEATYLPYVFMFKLDAGTSLCAAGSTMEWRNEDLSNNRSVYATVMAALIAGKSIMVYFDDAAPCRAQFIYIVA
ncbi:MAG: hypothetical protein ABIT83_11440 [Massilia sp.]